MRTTRMLVLTLPALLGAMVAGGQTPPNEAKMLVARVDAWYGGGARSVGAGFVVAVMDTALYLATARHCVAKAQLDGEPVMADSVWVTLYTQREGSARVLSRPILLNGRVSRTDRTKLDTLTNIDLALILVPIRDSKLLRELSGMLDRRASTAVHFGDPVRPMGCPNSCWTVPPAPDRVSLTQADVMVFTSVFVGPGSSGGPLFNDNWEVVALVTEMALPNIRAIPIDRVTTVLSGIGFPVHLRPSVFPRSGYPYAAELSYMQPLDHAPVPDSLRDPHTTSALRAVVGGPWFTAVDWQVAALRLSVGNNAQVTAAMGGLLWKRRASRGTAGLFGELGAVRVRERRDLGGYYVVASGATSAMRYVPAWKTEERDGAALGGGVRANVFLVPHVAVGGSAGYWSFSPPQGALPLPRFFATGGLQWVR